jgi:hypothetical protein
MLSIHLRLNQRMRRARSAALWCLSLVLVGCANPLFDAGNTETVLPLSRAWVDGKIVEYVVTDVSDRAMAEATGANHVPRLADALGAPGRRGVSERVYKFAANEQINVFQSAPVPAGPENADLSYSPLWRVVTVRWIKPGARRELRSEADVLSAEDAGDVSIEVTNIVINCPVTRGANGQGIRGVR